MKLNAEANLAKKLHTPIAVAANRVGKKYEFATKLMLKQQVTPNLVIKKKIKKSTESSCYNPHAKMTTPPMLEIVKARPKLSFTPILS